MKKQKGIAFLPTVLIISIIITELGLALAFIIYYSGLASYGVRLSQQALFSARSGANDAILQFSRDKTFNPSPYILSIGSASTTVTVTRNISTNQHRILSDAIVKNRERKIQADIVVDSDSDRISIISFNEI